MSVGLIVALIVAIAVVLSLAVDNDDKQTAQTSAPAAPLSYTVEGAGDGLVGGEGQAVVPELRSYTSEFQGEGLVGGEGQAVVPELRSYTSEFQGEGLVNTAGDLSMIEPTDGYHPNAGKFGFTEGETTLSYEEQARLAHDEMLITEGETTLTYYEEQARLANDEMLFKEWNDPLGWQATSQPEPRAALSSEEMLFLEQNGVYDFEAFGRGLAAVPTQPTVDLYARMKFIEMNTYLPGWTDDTAQRSDRQLFTEN